MKLLAAIGHELWGLFIDDGFLAVALLVWVFAVGLILPAIGMALAGGPILFFGCAYILIFSLRRATRR